MASSARPDRRRHRRFADRRVLTGLAIGAGLVGAVLPLPSAQAATTGQIRVDQVGYASGDTKIAYLMTSAAVSGASYQVVNAAGTVVATGSVGSTSRGSWNTAYPDVYPIDFSGVTTTGSYHLVISGGTTATSPTFQVQDAASLYTKLVADGVTFYQNQRDGSNIIPGALNRKPAHLNDTSASVYKIPTFQSGGNGDVISDSTLTKTGGPVDVSGGWFDAGDYLKFTFTAANADNLLYASARALGTNAPASLLAEAQYGTNWLNKMWNPATKTLYLQVGIGSGNASGSFLGDHDLWRLPEGDDSDTASSDVYAAAHRPVFQAVAPGALISPNLAGRLAASFALAAQADAAANPARATTELASATSLYALANTSPSGTLQTAAPNAYYPESIWHDAMELGAGEIVLAQQALGQPSSSYQPYLTQAASWASAYLSGDAGKDTLNLYDSSALAHADLLTAIANAGSPAGLAVTPASLIANLKAQVTSAATVSAADPFRAGGDYTNFDVNAHTFGFISTEALYRKASGDSQYAAFAGEQRDWLLGANAWGTSFMIGEGTTFPNCMGSQVPNLVGSTTGANPIDTGAVVNGPNGTSNFSGGLGSLQTGMTKCEKDSFTTFTGHGSEYVDDVRSWQTSEPALDMTGSAVLAGSLQAALAGGTTPPPTSDFSLTAAPATGSVQAGSAATATVSTAVTAGTAESVALSASGLPAGATASFSPASVTSGGSATLTVGTAATTPAGSYPITVTGTAATGSHTATYTLTVTTSASTCTAAQLLGNPGFENGATTAPWTTTSTLGQNPVNNDTVDQPAHSGSWTAWFDGNGKADTDTVAQSVTIPTGCTASLSYWLHTDTTENTTSATPDTLKVQLLNSGGTVLATLATYSNLSHNTGYAQHTSDLSGYAGQTVTLKFTGTETDANGGTTNFVLDDTALNVR